MHTHARTHSHTHTLNPSPWPLKVYGTTRNPAGASGRKLQAKGVTPLKGDFKDPASLVEALRTSGAKRVWFMTDFWGKDGGSRAKELAQVLVRVGVRGCWLRMRVGAWAWETVSEHSRK